MIRDFYEMAFNTPSDINDMLGLLRDIASACTHVTEFGVRGMVSTWAFLFGLPQGGKLVSVDTVRPETYGGNVEKAKILAESEGKSFEFILGDTREITIEPTDFLFIDTIHTKEQVQAELARHAHKVKKFIAFHDTVSCPEIYEAINGFLSKNPGWKKYIEYYENAGLLILRKV